MSNGDENKPNEDEHEKGFLEELGDLLDDGLGDGDDAEDSGDSGEVELLDGNFELVDDDDSSGSDDDEGLEKIEIELTAVHPEDEAEIAELETMDGVEEFELVAESDLEEATEEAVEALDFTIAADDVDADHVDAGAVDAPEAEVQEISAQDAEEGSGIGIAEVITGAAGTVAAGAAAMLGRGDNEDSIGEELSEELGEIKDGFQALGESAKDLRDEALDIAGDVVDFEPLDAITDAVEDEVDEAVANVGEAFEETTDEIAFESLADNPLEDAVEVKPEPDPIVLDLDDDSPHEAEVEVAAFGSAEEIELQPVEVAAETSSLPIDSAPQKPFETESFGDMKVAPAVPAKRNMLRDLAKVGLGLLLGAFALQAALWWGLLSDPAGLAKYMPKWAVPKALQAMPELTMPNRTTTPNIDDGEEGSGATELVDDATNSTDAGSNSSDDFVPTNDLVTDESSSSMNGLDGDVADSSLENTEGSGTAESDELGDLGSDLDDELAALDDGSETSNDLDEFGSDSADDNLASDFDSDMESDLDSDAEFGIDTDMGTTEPDSLAADDLFPEEPEEDGSGTSEDIFEPAVVTGLINSPMVSQNELATAIAASADWNDKLDDARISRDPELRSVAENFYRSFSQLAEQVTYIPRDGNLEIVDSARDLLSRFEFDTKKQRMIANASRNWIKNELGAGVLGAATVVSIEPAGNYHELKVNLLGKEATPMTLVTHLDPENNDVERFGVNSQLLYFGVVLVDPGSKLQEYNGQDRVIWISDQFRTLP